MLFLCSSAIFFSSVYIVTMEVLKIALASHSNYTAHLNGP